MAQTLIVQGGHPLVGGSSLPADKSISHRALILAALSDQVTRIDNLSMCGDVARTLGALRDIGVRIDGIEGSARRRGASESDSGSPVDGLAVRVHGCGVGGLGGPPVTLDCGDSGTTMRLLAGVLAGQAREFVLDGSPALRRRPMRRIVAPLRLMGADVSDRDGRPPLRGRGGTLVAADVTLEIASAQSGSAILLAGLNAVGDTHVRYPRPVRDHTERMLGAFGAPIDWDEHRSTLTGPVPHLRSPLDGLTVPADSSAALNLLAAATITAGSRLTFSGVGMNPGRIGLLGVLGRMGAVVEVTPGPSMGGEPTATLTTCPECLVAVELGGSDISRTIDELPLVAALGSQAQGVTVVRDAAELRVKECDRIAAVVAGLSRMGARVQERPDGFAVWGPSPLRGAEVDGRGDHRIVMALAVAALTADGETRIAGAECVSDSYPGFDRDLAGLGAAVTLRDS